MRGAALRRSAEGRAEEAGVSGERTRLTQVVFNLLYNAAKYTDPGGKIWLTVERDADQVVVRVRDNDTGKKPGLVPRVFDLVTRI